MCSRILSEPESRAKSNIRAPSGFVPGLTQAPNEKPLVKLSIPAAGSWIKWLDPSNCMAEGSGVGLLSLLGTAVSTSDR